MIDDYWRELVSSALLGTDRRDPPEAPGVLDELTRDAVRPDVASRFLVQVAGAVAVRRAAFLPAAGQELMSAPDGDDRPACSVAAARRWHHVISSWPLLEDEWMLTLIQSGQRLRPELVATALKRHRRDAVRFARASVAAGSIAPWLVKLFPELARTGAAPPPADMLGELPVLPVPPELAGLMRLPGDAAGRSIVEGVGSGALTHAHRGVLVNLTARIEPSALPGFVDVLSAAEPTMSGAGLVATVHDVARTRRLMLDELDVSAGVETMTSAPPEN